MITDAYIAIDRIVQNRDVSFNVVMLELYDQIFQKSWTIRQQKSLFIFALIRLDQFIYEQPHNHDHLFVAYLHDKNADQEMDEVEMISLTCNFTARKSFYQRSFLKACLSVFSIFRDPALTGKKYLVFTVFMRSGFIPFDQNHNVFVSGEYDEGLAQEACLQLEAMNWICASDEYRFVYYSLNVLKALAEYPATQQIVQLKFAALMKGRGYLEGYQDGKSSLPTAQSEATGFFASNLARSLQR